MNKFLFVYLLWISSLFASNGEMLYTQKCQNCHGNNGQLSALGHSESITGWDVKKTLKALHGYKEGTRNTNGMGAYMQIKMSDFNDEDINELAKYIATLKKGN